MTMQHARPSAISILSRQVSWRVSAGAPDPIRVLRLASIRLVEMKAAGRRLHRHRVEIEGLTDIGAVAPLLDNKEMRCDRLPAA
jgi:hypothetical protein